jgi:hypothetical protein
MRNAIYKVWNRVADWIDAAIEFYDWWIDRPGQNNRFNKPDVILPLPKKRRISNDAKLAAGMLAANLLLVSVAFA